MKYMIEETYIRTYLIEAESMDKALVEAFEIDDSWDYDESSLGFTYIKELQTGRDRVL